jgi:hypothetical protein
VTAKVTNTLKEKAAQISQRGLCFKLGKGERSRAGVPVAYRLLLFSVVVLALLLENVWHNKRISLIG